MIFLSCFFTHTIIVSLLDNILIPNSFMAPIFSQLELSGSLTIFGFLLTGNLYIQGHVFFPWVYLFICLDNCFFPLFLLISKSHTHTGGDKRQKDIEKTCFSCFTPQGSSTARAGSSKSQEPWTPSWFPRWVTGPSYLYQPSKVH